MKKWSKLILATMLSAGILLVSGCIENIEPEGIADLRGAKAELLRAQTALQAAQAAKVEAEAALVLAQAKVQEAIAKQEEAKVAYEEAKALKAQYEAEYQRLVNEAYAQEQADEHAKRVQELEEKIAEHEQAMAAAEMAAALAAEKFKIAMLQVTQALAEAQLQYDQALLDIEVAKATLTDEQADFIDERFTAVYDLKMALRMITENLEEAADALAEATAELDEPRAQRVAIKRAERVVAVAQATFEAAQEAEAEAKALLELDPMVTDWDAQREAINEELDALRSERDAKYVEATDRAEVWRDSIDILDDLADEYEAFTGYTFNDQTGYFSKLPGYVTNSIEIPEVYVPAPKDEDGNPLFGGDFKIAGVAYEYGNEDSVIEMFEDRLKTLNTWSTVTYEARIEALNIAIENLENSQQLQRDMAQYTDVVAAYNSEDLNTYFKKYVYNTDNGYDDDFTVKGLLDEYNAAIKTLKDAIATYDAEMAKYNPDWSEQYAAIDEKYNNAVAQAAAARASEMQAAENEYTAQKLAWAKAQNAYEQATANYNASVLAAETTAGADRVTMQNTIDAYDALVNGGATLTEDQKKEYDTYTSCLAIIAKAQLAYKSDDSETDATDVYLKADAAQKKAKNDYDEALAKAQSTYETTEKAADQARTDAVEELAASYPTINADNHDYLKGLVDDAVDELQALVAEINRDVSGVWCGVANPYSVVYEGEYISRTISSIPDYLVDITTDPVTNDRVYTQLEASMELITDMDYFLDNVVRKAADNLLYDYFVVGYDQYGDFLFYKEFSILGEYDGYPLELPTYEMYAEAVENVDLHVAAQNKYNELVSEYTADGYVVGNGYYVVNTTSYNQILRNQIQIAELQADMAYIALVPDFVKAVEAAKAEFVAFAAEEAARIDDLKTKVEANYPRLLAEAEAVDEETKAFDAKVETLEHTLGTLDYLIGKYCDGYIDLDDFVASLETAYEDAVQATLDAEQDVIDAEDDLQNLKDGLVTAVEVAQKHYDAVKEEFDLCQAMLEAAVEDLEEAIALVYGDEELPEDPGTEDPDAGEEGGDTEGGEEETPAA
ncbi:MAG: hypothetical protein IJ394_06435 [Bacteroidales bacterium]|nr:hypothetical protein [Bacteroidales bacterium]